MAWKIIDTGSDKPAAIMQKDADFLESLFSEQDPILHLYHFQPPSATYGHFLNPDQFFCADGLKKRDLHIAKRPTGGGIIFHLWDLAFSVLIPSSHRLFSQNTLENYATVNNPVLAAVEEFLQLSGCELTPEDGKILGPGAEHFCMAKPTRYDVMLQGKKVAGAAQRKTKQGLLHQGTISLMLPSKEFLEDVLLSDPKVLESMFTYTFPLLGQQASLQDLTEGRRQMKELLQKHLLRE